jgi:rhamnosyl/mannosyltransferase
VHRVPLDFEIASTGFSFAAIRKLARLAREADVIHYHFPWPFMDWRTSWRASTSPVRGDLPLGHRAPENLLRVYSPLKRRFLRSVDTVVATSPNYLASSPVLKRFAHKTRTITYGLDKSIYPVRRKRQSKWRAQLRRALLPVRRRAALLQGPAHPAGRHGQSRLPGGDRRRRPGSSRSSSSMRSASA